MRLNMIPIVIGVLGTVTKGLEKQPEGIGNQGKNGDYSDSSIISIG